jgi:hypothetical protein
MRASTISKGLLILGALLGAATGVALALGVRLDHLPPWMITVGMYKLAFLAAGGLFVIGAMVGRAAHNTLRRRERTDIDPQLDSGSVHRVDSDRIPRQQGAAYRERREP